MGAHPKHTAWARSLPCWQILLPARLVSGGACRQRWQGPGGRRSCEDAAPGVEEDGAHGDDAMARDKEESLWWLGPTRLCEIVALRWQRLKAMSFGSAGTWDDEQWRRRKGMRCGWGWANLLFCGSLVETQGGDSIHWVQFYSHVTSLYRTRGSSIHWRCPKMLVSINRYFHRWTFQNGISINQLTKATLLPSCLRNNPYLFHMKSKIEDESYNRIVELRDLQLCSWHFLFEIVHSPIYILNSWIL